MHKNPIVLSALDFFSAISRTLIPLLSVERPPTILALGSSTALWQNSAAKFSCAFYPPAAAQWPESCLFVCFLLHFLALPLTQWPIFCFGNPGKGNKVECHHQPFSDPSDRLSSRPHVVILSRGTMQYNVHSSSSRMFEQIFGALGLI